MRRFAVSGASLLMCASALTQSTPSPDQFIASRQSEVERMAEIFYNTHLDTGNWTKHDLPECSVLPHHAFVRFDSTAVNGAPASFLAIYDLNHPPARSKDQPWQGGITFVRVRPHQQSRQDTGPSPDYLIVAFNRALKQERAVTSARPPSSVTDAQAIASCFIGISDNTPETPIASESSAPYETPPLRISGLLIPLTGSSTLTRTQYINFDKDGLILEAGVSVTPK